MTKQSYSDNSLDSSVFSEEWQNKTAQRAKHNKAIGLWELAYIMAADESYNDILLKLWEVYDLNKANKIPVFRYSDRGKEEIDGILYDIDSWEFRKEINTNTAQERAGVWFLLLMRWAVILEYEKVFFKGLPIHPSLPVFYYEGGELRKVERDEKERKDDHFVKLDDLKAFLNDIEKIYKLSIPLPIRLFDEITDKKPIEQDEVKELTAHEDFIKNLRIFYGSDEEIKIQEPRKTSIIYHCKKIGFQHEETKEWKDFLGFLREPNHAYYLGPAYIYSLDGSRKIRTKNKSYDRKRKRLEAINKKLIDFFNDNYPVNIPEGYKLYEPCQIQKKRGYTFKFQMVDTTTMNGNLESKYNSYTKDQLINKTKELGKKYLETLKFKDNEVEANNFLEMFNITSMIAVQKDWITKDRIADMLDLKKYKEVYSDVKEKPVKSIDHT